MRPLDFCNLKITILHKMIKILMDSDCIIKITRAGLKEVILDFFDVFIAEEVKIEVIDKGLRKGYTDAKIVKENIEKNKIKIIKGLGEGKGDDAIIKVFDRKMFNFVGTDDKRLVKKLEVLGIPYVVPGLLIYFVYKQGKIRKEKALSFLEKLSSYISDDEYSIVKLLIEGGK